MMRWLSILLAAQLAHSAGVQDTADRLLMMLADSSRWHRLPAALERTSSGDGKPAFMLSTREEIAPRTLMEMSLQWPFLLLTSGSGWAVARDDRLLCEHGYFDGQVWHDFRAPRSQVHTAIWTSDGVAYRTDASSLRLFANGGWHTHSLPGGGDLKLTAAPDGMPFAYPLDRYQRAVERIDYWDGAAWQQINASDGLVHGLRDIYPLGNGLLWQASTAHGQYFRLPSAQRPLPDGLLDACLAAEGEERVRLRDQLQLHLHAALKALQAAIVAIGNPGDVYAQLAQLLRDIRQAVQGVHAPREGQREAIEACRERLRTLRNGHSERSRDHARFTALNTLLKELNPPQLDLNGMAVVGRDNAGNLWFQSVNSTAGRGRPGGPFLRLTPSGARQTFNFDGQGQFVFSGKEVYLFQHQERQLWRVQADRFEPLGPQLKPQQVTIGPAGTLIIDGWLAHPQAAPPPLDDDGSVVFEGLQPIRSLSHDKLFVRAGEAIGVFPATPDAAPAVFAQVPRALNPEISETGALWAGNFQHLRLELDGTLRFDGERQEMIETHEAEVLAHALLSGPPRFAPLRVGQQIWFIKDHRPYCRVGGKTIVGDFADEPVASRHAQLFGSFDDDQTVVAVVGTQGLRLHVADGRIHRRPFAGCGRFFSGAMLPDRKRFLAVDDKRQWTIVTATGEEALGFYGLVKTVDRYGSWWGEEKVAEFAGDALKLSQLTLRLDVVLRVDETRALAYSRSMLYELRRGKRGWAIYSAREIPYRLEGGLAVIGDEAYFSIREGRASIRRLNWQQLLYGAPQ